MKLHRQLGISYNAAWRMRHKLMQVMMERDREHVLGGFIQLDDAYLGGERSGGKRGRGAPGKTPFVAAVETNEAGHPQRVKLTVVEGFRLTEIAAWAQQHLSPGTQVLSDGLACFNGVTAAGCVHEPMVTGGGKAAVERPEFRWVNTILGNIKNALRGTYHAVRPKYAQRYLAEFEYRFNRRFDLPDIIPRLVYVALRTPPMPERLLKLRLARVVIRNFLIPRSIALFAFNTSRRSATADARACARCRSRQGGSSVVPRSDSPSHRCAAAKRSAHAPGAFATARTRTFPSTECGTGCADGW